jgi:hypothetical protein
MGSDKEQSLLNKKLNMHDDLNDVKNNCIEIRKPKTVFVL